MMAINQHVVQYVSMALRKASQGMLDHFVVEMYPEELYAMLCGYDGEMLAAFSKAASYMPQHDYIGPAAIQVLMRGHSQVMQVPLYVALESCSSYPRYFMPERLATITPESSFYETLVPAIVLAQEWKITIDLFEQFSSLLNTDQIAFVLPWLRELGRDACLEMEKQPLKLHNVPGRRLAAMKAAFIRLGNPGRAATPALTRRINEATRLGDRLFTQWRMLKKQNYDRTTFVSVPLDNALLPDWYKADMDDIRNSWVQETTVFDL
jgi:hypothetical protein